MNRTQIEWVKNPNGSPGYTWNPITGCLNHDNGLCKGGGFPCYAYKLANGRLKPLYLANENYAPVDVSNVDMIDPADDPFYPRFWDERVREEFGAKTAGAIPKGIFVCDMGDLFGQGIPEQWTRRVLSHIGMSWYSEHRFYLLTKQPQNLIKFSPFPDNCWVGVSVCNDKMLDIAVDKLEDVQAKIKFISFEPLIERLTLSLDYAFYYSGINWLIIGACTGSFMGMVQICTRYPELTLMPCNKRWTLQPKIEWVREIVEAADKAGVKVFLKDNLAPLIKWPQDGPWAFKNLSNMLRQEMPEIK